jgi:hypothetical protein
MSIVQIEDGTGKGGYGVKVDSSSRLYTNSVNRPHNDDASLSGDSFNINTGIVSLTSANKSAVFYLENTGTKPIVLTALFYLIGNSTGGSGDMLITVIRNPTAGTIISNGVVAEMAGVNRNFGSSKTLEATVYKGVDGDTFTNGDKLIESIFNQSPSRSVVGLGTIVLERGNSIGIEITPATGNTSLDVEFATSAFIEVDS